jgi:hypothetical protein
MCNWYPYDNTLSALGGINIMPSSPKPSQALAISLIKFVALFLFKKAPSKY